MSGVPLAQYLVKLSQNGVLDKRGRGGGQVVNIGSTLLKQLKGAKNAASRLHNWNIIIKELEKVGIELDDERKSLIIAGDQDSISGIYLDVLYLELQSGIHQDDGKQFNSASLKDRTQQQPSMLSVLKEAKPEQPINIMELNGSKPLNQTKSTLEFVIVSLCQSLNITPKQAAGLLTDHNYYLMHACVKGVKGDYAPIIKWYQVLYQQCKHLIELAVESLPEVPQGENLESTSLNDSQILEEDTQPLFVLLSALKCGFYSEYFTVSDLAFKLFSKISTDLNSFGYQKVFARWYLQVPEQDNGKLGGGLEATLFMLDKHSQIVESVALLIISTFHGSFELLIPEIKENHIKDNLPKLYTLLNDLLPFLHKHHRAEVAEKLLRGSSLIEELLKHADTNKNSENLIKAAALSLLAEIWYLEPALISDDTKKTNNGLSILELTLKVFKNTCKFSSKGLKLSTLGLMFKLLDQFASSRDSQAPVIYKLLTFTLIENIQDDDIRDYMQRSFTSVFKQHKTIPVSILIEPLLRIAQVSEKRYDLNVSDFQFFATLANHPKLTAFPIGLQIMDLFAKITLNDQIWCSSAKVPLLTLAQRFQGEQEIQEFLLKFSSLAITSVLKLNKQGLIGIQTSKISPKSLKTASPGVANVFSLKNQRKLVPKASPKAEQSSSQANEIARRIKLATIVHIIEKIVSNLKLPQSMIESIRSHILHTNRQYHQIHGLYSKALLHLLEHWHSFDAHDIMEKYMHECDERENPKPDESEIDTVRKAHMTSHIREEDGGAIKYMLQETRSSQDADLPSLQIEEMSEQNHRFTEAVARGSGGRRIPSEGENDYFRLLPSETRNSEISQSALNNINNQSYLSGHNRSQSQHGNRQLVPYQQPNQKVPQENNQVALVQSVPTLAKPNIPTARRVKNLANKHIEAIKNKRDEKANKQRMEEERKRIQQEQNIIRAKEVVAKRRIELGILKGPSVEGPSGESRLMLYDTTAEPEEQQQKTSPRRISLGQQRGGVSNAGAGSEGLRLIDLENEEEERDRDGVRCFLQKYQKVFKFLFNKYALSRAQHQKVENFEYFGDKSINLAEICKLLRDHDLLASLSETSILTQVVVSKENAFALHKIPKDHVQTLMRLLNLKNIKRQDLSALNFNHFMELVPQMAFLMYQRTLSHLSLPEMLQKMIEYMERAARYKGQSTILYEDPDISSIGDQEILKELNRRVRDIPDFILPEGYYKVQEKEQIFKYELPSSIPIKESQRVAVEVLDELIHQSLGFHFLEALVTYEHRFKVKPRIKHSSQKAEKDQNSALSFMKPIERKPFNRDGSLGGVGIRLPSNSAGLPPVAQQVSTPLQTPLSVDLSKTKLGASLKLELISQTAKQQTPQEKQALLETAQVLEDLLQAVESGKTTISTNKPSKEDAVKNKAQEEKEARTKQEQLIQKQKEEMRKRRHAKLQSEIEKQKQDKIKQEEELKAAKEQKEAEDKQNQRKERSLLRQKVEAKRQQIEEVKRQKQEEKENKEREEEERKLREKQARAQNQKEFFRKQKEQLEQEFIKRRQDQQEAERLKQEMEVLKREQQEKAKNKMVNFMKNHKDQQRNEQAEWQDIQTFYDNPELQAIFQKYEKSMGQMFKHYAVLDKKDMTGQGLKRISFNEFSKFGYQTKITPKVISTEDMVLIFRALVRERTSTMTQEEVDQLGLGVNSLGLEDFKKALIRIAILGQVQLGEDELLEHRLPDYTNQPDAKLPPTVRAPKNVRVRGRSTLHSGASNRQRLQKQNSQLGIDPPEANNGETSQENIVSNRHTSLIKKTKEAKLLEELTKVKNRQEKMSNLKIEDKKMTKGFDVSLINTRTIEALIQFLQIQPNDEKRKVNQLLLDGANEEGQPEVQQEPIEGYDEQQPEEQVIEGVDLEDLERQGDYDENIVGPNGETESWKIAD